MCFQPCYFSGNLHYKCGKEVIALRHSLGTKSGYLFVQKPNRQASGCTPMAGMSHCGADSSPAKNG